MARAASGRCNKEVPAVPGLRHTKANLEVVFPRADGWHEAASQKTQLLM